MPKQKSIITPPSSCTNCNAQIKPWHNIPIISWILLKGKCRYCNDKISIRYPIIEFLTGIIAVLVYKKMGSIDIFFIINFSIFATFLALSIIDFDYKAVPDSLNLLALSLSFFSSINIIDNFTNALIVMGGMSLIRYYVSYFIQREAMGEGDIIIGGTMGAILGVKLAIIAIFIASLIAIFPSIYNRVKNFDFELPFIPFLSLATFIVWLFDSYFLNIWREIYG